MKSKFLILILLLPLSVLSQNKFKGLNIKGLVVDSAVQKSMPYATISVYKMPGDTVKKKMVSNADGSFELQVSDTGKYKITVQMIGYATYNQLFTVDDSTKLIDLGKIIIAEAAQTLGEVSIVADKPLIKVDADKITYSAESDPESKTSNVLDMMRKVPLISVDGDDNIQLKGASNFKIFLNGKPSTMLSNNPKDVLKSMPASSVKDIEVITSPGAKYDAEGVGGIINIITSKKSANGYNCSINLGAGTSGYVNSGLNFTATIGKFAFSTNLSGYYFKAPVYKNNKYRENYNMDDQKYTFYEGSTHRTGMHPWGNAELSYELDTLNLISAAVNFWYGQPEGSTETHVSVYDAANQLVKEYQMINKFKDGYGAPEGNIDFQHTFKKNKEQILTLSYKFSQNPDNSSGETEYIPIKNSTANFKKSSTEASSLEQTFQADYVQPFSKKHVLELGSKYIFRKNSSLSEYLDLEDNKFDYTQKIAAAYASVNFKFEKISIKTGVRMEKSVTDGSISSQDTSFSNKSLDFVPTVNLSYQISPEKNIKLTYDMHIQRPNIWFLNPYIDKLDDENVRYGNPKLETERYHNIELNYGNFGKKGNLNLTLFYSFSNNSIEDYVWMVDTVAYTTYYNLGKFWSSGCSFYGSVNFGPKFSANLGGSIRYTDIESTMDEKVNTKGWGENFNLNVRYTILKDYKLSAYGGVYIDGGRLQSKSYPYYYHGISLNKSFFKDKLTFSISARNPFMKERTYTYETLDTDFRIKTDYISKCRSFGLNISFRFGEMEGEVKKTKRGINNDDVKSGQGSGGGDGGGK